MVSALVCLLASVAIAWVVINPWFNLPDALLVDTESLSRLELRRQSALQSLKDIELDYKTGKTGEAEYQNLRARASSELLQTLRELDRVAPRGETRDAV